MLISLGPAGTVRSVSVPLIRRAAVARTAGRCPAVSSTVPGIRAPARRSRQHGGTPARLRCAKVAEFQARGAVHLHALLRLDGDDPDNPKAVLAPPS
jgi:replication initiator protein RepSA